MSINYNYALSSSPTHQLATEGNPLLNVGVQPLPGGVDSSASITATIAVVGVFHPNTTITAGSVSLEQSFSGVLYNHIHIYDRAHDFGDVTSAKVQYFEVWNAYSSSKTLDPITASAADGVYLTSLGNYTTEGFVAGAPQTPPTLPTTYPIGGSRKYAITAGVNGGLTLLGSFTFVFASAESPAVTFTGSRTTLLMGAANWRDIITEKISYVTDISSPVSGNEQRRCLTRSPRRRYSYTITPRTPRESSIIRSVIWGAQVKKILAMEWPEQTFMTASASVGATTIYVDTQNRDFFVGGLATIYAGFDSFEVVSILTVSAGNITLDSPTLSAWPAFTKVVPTRYARIDQSVQAAQHTSTVAEIAMSLEIDPTNSPVFASGYAYPYTYRGYNVFMERNNDIDLLSNRYGRNTTVLDNRTGLYHYTQWATYPYLTYQYSFLRANRAAIANHRKFIEDCKGRFKPFWMPSWQADMEVTAISGTQVTFNSIGLARYVGVNPGLKDFALIKPDLTAVFRRISSVIDNGDGTETITADSSVPGTPGDYMLSCFLRFCRLDSDEFAFEWETNEIVKTDLPIRILSAL